MTSTTELKGTVKLCEDTGAALTISKPITVGYPVPTVNTQIGYFASPTVTWSTAQYGLVATLPSLPIGVYLINVAITANGTFVSNFLYFVGNPVSIVKDYRIPMVYGTDRTIANGCYLLNLTQTGTITLNNYAANQQYLLEGNVNIVRLS